MQGRRGEMMATKGSFSTREPFPHADLNLLSLSPLSPLLPSSYSDIQPSSRLHREQRRAPSQGVNPAGGKHGPQGLEASLQRLWVLESNEI